MKYLFLLLFLTAIFSCASRKCCPDIITWKKGKSSPIELRDPLVFSDDHYIYVLSTSGEFARFEPGTKTWSALPTIPHAVGFASGALLNGAIYIFSGMDYTIKVTKAVQKYDIAQNRWFQMLPMKNPRKEAVAVAFNDKIYLMGGNNADLYSDSSFISSLVEEFDPVNDTWIQKTEMPTARDNHAAVRIGDNILVAGGFANEGKTKIVEAYDPVKDQWARKADLPSPNALFSLISIQNTIYSLGGYPYRRAILKYDVNADQWTQVSILPKGKIDYGTTAADDRIYLIGGYRNTQSVLIGKRG